MMIGDMTSTWWKHYASQIPLSVPWACYFFRLCVFTMCIIEKLAKVSKPPNKKYLCWDNKTWSAPVPDTCKRTEKIAGCCHFQVQCNWNVCHGKFL